VYTSVLHHVDAQQTLLQVLERFCLLDGEHRNASLFALSTVWSAFDAIHQRTTTLPLDQSDKAWWIPDIDSSDDFQSIISFLLQSLLQDSSSDPATCLLRTEERRAAYVNSLCILIRYDENDWIYAISDSQVDDLLKALSSEASRLYDPNMPVSECTRHSLASLQLWVLVSCARRAAEDSSSLNDLMDSVVRAALASEDDPVESTHHRWAQAKLTTLPVSSWSQGVLIAVFQSSLMGIQKEVATHPLLRQRARDCLSSLSGEEISVTHHHISKIRHLWFLLRCCPSVVLDSVSDLELNESFSPHLIPRNLLRVTQQTDDALLLLSSLSRVLHSAVAQSKCFDPLRSALDTSVVSKCCDFLKSRTNRESLHFHLVRSLSALDVCYTALSLSESTRLSFLSMLDEKMIKCFDSLLGIPDKEDQSFDSAATELSTPRMNNQSLVVETPVDGSATWHYHSVHMISLAAARCLAALARTHSLADDSSSPPQQHVCKMIHEFISSIQDNGLVTKETLETSTRVTHVLRELALDPANSQYLSFALYTHLCAIRTSLNDSQSQLQLLEKEVSRVRKENKSLKESLDLQLNTKRRQMLRSNFDAEHMRKRIDKLTVDYFSALEAERKAFEAKHDSLSLQLCDVRKKLSTSNTAREEAERRNREAQKQLEDSQSLITIAKRNEEQSMQRALHAEERVAGLEATIHRLEEENEVLSSKEAEWTQQVGDQTEMLEAADQREADLRDSLEDLFSDMVGLADLYVKQEKEVEASKAEQTQASDLKAMLKEEQRKRREAEEKLRTKTMEAEDLSNKCARTRKKLEDERKLRSRASAQRSTTSSASYMNHLNHSNLLDHNESTEKKGSQATRKTLQMDRTSRSRKEKENRSSRRSSRLS